MLIIFALVTVLGFIASIVRFFESQWGPAIGFLLIALAGAVMFKIVEDVQENK